MNIPSNNMITQQLRTGDVLNTTILDLFQDIPRSEFVPEAFKAFAYSDLQIELNHNQRMMTPLEEGKILQALNLQGHEVVLEIGTGTGFFTALLSRLCKKVISIEFFPDLSATAKNNLKRFQCDNVELITGDGIQGWLDAAPYDVMVISGAVESLTETLRLQIVPGGQLFAIVGIDPIMQGQLHQFNHTNQWHKEVIFETNIPPLLNTLKKKDFVF